MPTGSAASERRSAWTAQPVTSRAAPCASIWPCSIDAACGAATEVAPQVHLADRSRGALDGRPWRAGVLRLLDQLPDRSAERRHRRCRGDDRASDRPKSTPTKTMIERDERPLRPEARAPGRRHRLWLAADAGLAGHEQGIEPHIPVFDKSERKDGTFIAQRLHLRPASDVYVCPAGKMLQARARRLVQRRRSRALLYRASQGDCAPCPLKPRCCPKHPDPQDAAQHPRRRAGHGPRASPRPTPTTVAHDRKKVEMLFAHLKRILKLDRLRLRGERRARRVPPRATAQNLRRMAKWFRSRQ